MHNQNGTPMPRPATVGDLCDRYLEWAQDYYRHPRRPDEPDADRQATRHRNNLIDATRWLLDERNGMNIAALPVDEFSDEHLYLVQQFMVKQPRQRDQRPMSADYINKTINQLRHMFKWARKPPRRWVPASLITDLHMIESLRTGRSNARDSRPIEAVDETTFMRTLWAIRELRAAATRRTERLRLRQLHLMMRIQWMTGMRPGELQKMRWDEISVERFTLAPPETGLFDQTPANGSPAGANGQSSGGREVEMMVYRPFLHKTRHHGHERTVYFPPRARRLLEKWRRRTRRVAASDQNLVWSSPVTYLGTNSYNTAIAKITSVGDSMGRIDHWCANQVRHAFACRMREAVGLDPLQILMGHADVRTTQGYAKAAPAAAIMAIFRNG